jgi:hypothetical protein
MSEPKLKVVQSENDSAAEEGSTEGTKRKRRPNRPIPPVTLEKALNIARSIADNNAGKPYSRLSIADTLQRSPDSAQFRDMITASSQYGLTKGSYKAPQISLTELGEAIVMPKDEMEVSRNLLQAFLSVPMYKRLAEHFDGNRIPQETHFRNTLVREFSIDLDWALQTVQDFTVNAKYVGIVRTVSGVERIDLAGAMSQDDRRPETLWDEPTDDSPEDEPDEQDYSAQVGRPAARQTSRVFITHGKNRAIVNQLKEILQFGKFEPVVAEEQETTSRPVPEKVLSSMRDCFAGVIHIEEERELMDPDGKTYQYLNQNVLIEIGAAMALYGNNFVLLVKKGVTLPSNLQGLYRCDYEGDRLDYEATMKLLRTFNSFDQ